MRGVQSTVSAEAIRAVIQRSPARGTGRLILLLIAHASPDRGNYPKAAIGFGTLAKQTRLSIRRIKAAVAELVETGKLFVINQGGGENANTYEIPVLKADGVAVLDSTPVIREEPLERPSRAPNVISLPTTYPKERTAQ